MCGIAGFLQMNGGKASAERLAAMLAPLRHRGPDAAGIFIDRAAGLAHARLSIIDLENGQQPMQTADGRLAVTFNGEIFNYLELRDELLAKGHTFRTRSDTEVILHAYAEYGERCVEHFNGQWAFAIWDRRERTLFLSRDRLGIRPLFYTRAGGRFLFASEIKSLFTQEEVTRELDPRGIVQVFTYWSTLPPATVFRDICELAPGHNLTLQNGRLQDHAYWQLNYAPEHGERPIEEWAEQLRSLLDDATRLRLRADVPVGAYLSGGLDSSLTTALAQRTSGDRLQTFSVTFEETEFDESEYQQQVVDRLGVQHHSLRCSHDDIARVFPDVVRYAEKPVLRTAPAPLHLLSQLVHQEGFKVVLTGEGADELLGGYDLFKEAKVRRFFARQPDSAMRSALFARLYPYLPGLQSQSVAMRRAFFHARPEDLDSPFFSHMPRWQMTAQLTRLLSPEFVGPHDPDADYADASHLLPDGFGGWHPFCQAQFLETAILMPGYILSSQGDRAAMAHSVEGRFPFLDHRLAEFAARLPVRWKMSGLTEKYLLKRALGHLVPAAVVNRTKQPYRAPDATSFFSPERQSARQDYVDEVLSQDHLQSAGLFRPEAVEGLLRKVRSGRARGARDNMALVGVLSTQLLHDQFVHHCHCPSDASAITAAVTDVSFVSQPVTASTE